jgi:transcriptional regulator with XRE-family HTH domain
MMSYVVDMHSTPSENIANQLRRRRRQLDLNRQQLAEKCASVGAPQLTLAALTNIETGRPDANGKRRRDITVDELLALAHALGIHPVDLMVPGDAPDKEPYSVTPDVTTTAAKARDWIAGIGFLVEPESPMEFAVAIQAMPKGRAEAVSKEWLRPRVDEWNRQDIKGQLDAEAEAAEEYRRQAQAEEPGKDQS